VGALARWSPDQQERGLRAAASRRQDGAVDILWGERPRNGRHAAERTAFSVDSLFYKI